MFLFNNHLGTFFGQSCFSKKFSPLKSPLLHTPLPLFPLNSNIHPQSINQNLFHDHLFAKLLIEKISPFLSGFSIPSWSQFRHQLFSLSLAHLKSLTCVSIRVLPPSSASNCVPQNNLCSPPPFPPPLNFPSPCHPCLSAIHSHIS